MLSDAAVIDHKMQILRSFGSRVLRIEGQNIVCISSDCWYPQRISIHAFRHRSWKGHCTIVSLFAPPAQYHALAI
jgi:hypothetical protein